MKIVSANEKAVVVTAAGGEGSITPTNFEVDIAWPYGPAIKHLDGKNQPMAAADWYGDMLQFEIFQEASGDPLMSIRLINGKIVEIIMPRALAEIISYEGYSEETLWEEKRNRNLGKASKRSNTNRRNQTKSGEPEDVHASGK